ncbi:PqqD family protein [Paenibacillus flagellatus]|uniref:Peptidase n=1 Tax=Paenibacillus flagellatus TaxID=2211139 RepID=A0A2V5K5F5_9BACL|nr:PqqD family protein [Paenibacillus flagellatus]PYI54488.1 hypothetical protein DLM86_13560 [Paenibacillus flagellatus]
MNVTKESRVVPVELTVRPDRGGFIVEDARTGDYYEMPEPAVEALRRMREGGTLGEIGAELAGRYPDEEIDMVGFAGQLFELGLVAQVDGTAIGNGRPDGESEASAAIEGGVAGRNRRERGGFLWIPQSFARLWVHPAVRAIAAAAVCANIALIAAKPELLPRYRDAFPFESMALNGVTWLVVSLALVLLHELGHIMALRAYGLPAKLGIGHRTIFVVLETEMDGIWRLEPKQRHVAYLAGMGADQLVLLLALAVQAAYPGEGGWALKLAAFAAMDLFVKTLFQCCLFMKTDLYYVLENGTGCYNLMERSRRWLAVTLGGGSDGGRGADKEPRAVRLYAVLLVAGYAFQLGLLAFYFAPQLIASAAAVVPHLADWDGGAAFWDAVVFVLEFALAAGLLVYSWRKQRGGGAASRSG